MTVSSPAQGQRRGRVALFCLSLVALACLLVLPASASAELHGGWVSDPANDVNQNPDGSYVFGDVRSVSAFYDDASGRTLVQFDFSSLPSGFWFSGTAKLGQAWDGTKCTVDTTRYDQTIDAYWDRFFYNETTYEYASAYLSAVGVEYTEAVAEFGTKSLTMIGEAPVYQNRPYVCVGGIDLGNGEKVADFAFLDTPPPPPPPPLVLQITKPVVLENSTYDPGNTVTGTVSWENIGTSTLTARRAVITARPPGVAHGGSPAHDFVPILKEIPVAAGAVLNHKASFKLPADAKPGRWEAFAAWQGQDLVWHDGPSVPFTVRAPGSPGTGPSGGPVTIPGGTTPPAGGALTPPGTTTPPAGSITTPSGGTPTSPSAGSPGALGAPGPAGPAGGVLGVSDDGAAPAVTLALRNRTLSALRRGRLRVVVTCSEACVVNLALRYRSTLIARGVGSTEGAGDVSVRMALTNKGRKLLKRLRGKRLILRGTATDLAGNKRALATTLRLR